MTRRKIVRAIDGDAAISLFRERADAFCGWIEKCIGELQKWAKDKKKQESFKRAKRRIDSERMKHSNWLIHRNNRDLQMAASGKTPPDNHKFFVRLNQHLSKAENDIQKRLPGDDWGAWNRRCAGEFIASDTLWKGGEFYAPPDIILPYNWLIPGEYNPRRAKPEDDPQHLQDFFLIAVLHDNTITEGESSTILRPNYKGKFQRDAFANALWKAYLKDEAKSDARIHRAWQRVKGLLTNTGTNGKRVKTGRKAGRRPLGSREADKRREIIQAWERAKDSGVPKSEFCHYRHIETAYLETCLDWSRKQNSPTT